MLAPENTILIIDEPELYLNASIYSKLWNLLESTRSDCRFIYISHQIDFIESRQNSDIIWCKSFVYPNKWDIVLIDNEVKKEYRNDILIELTGAKKDIVFCEGNHSSLDYTVYSALFPEYTIIPVGNCETVIKYVKTYNSSDELFSATAYGIIDNDLRTEGYIYELLENNIFCTKYLEIEMILCYEVVINAVLDGKLPDHVNASKVDDFKQQFIDKMNERKEMVILRRLKKMYENKLSKTVYNTKQHIDENIYSLVSDLENLSIDLESFKTELKIQLKVPAMKLYSNIAL